MQPVLIDGTMGEGGGQILRTSLALSMITGTPLQLVRIRGGRKRPGLMRQHLTGVLAAAEICGAEVIGASLHSDRLQFTPGAIRVGTYQFSVGTAGSTALVLQAVLPALLSADGPSEITIEGGTHAIKAPSFHFLLRSFMPAIARFGASVTLEMPRWGFYPAGGGCIQALIEPAAWRAASFLERGPITRAHAVAVVSGLSTRIARDEVRALLATRGLEGASNEIIDAPSPGPGNVAWVELEHGAGTTIVTECGQRGVPARRIARAIGRQAGDFLAADVPVGEHLADQLLLPMALARGGAVRTLPPSLHTTTNIEVIQRFLPVRFEIEEDTRRSVVIRCVPTPA